MIVEPYPAAVSNPQSPTVGVGQSLSMWGTVSAALRGHRDATPEILLPRTLPVLAQNDVTPYHWVENESGNLSLRKGAPPKAVREAVVALGNGETTVNEFLDRIGVPQA